MKIQLKSFSLLLAFLFVGTTLTELVAQNTPQPNYELAARYSPTQLRKLVFSTRVSPTWLSNSDRFWYMYETTEGKSWYIVDPARGTKQALFDNHDVAAQMSTLTGDPFDWQNLDIQRLKFAKNETVLQWNVTSKLVEEEEKTDEDEKKEEKKDDAKKDGDKKDGDVKEGEKKEDKKPKKRRKKPKMVPKVWHFEYNLATKKVTLREDVPKDKKRVSWANISPDSSYVLFARHHNLYWMDKENFLKAQKDDKDTTIVEHQWTTDGEEHYAYGSSGRGNDAEKKKNKDKRKSVGVLWSPDGKKFALTRTDNRKVEDLWVINNVARPRPQLETYKYAMAGAKEVGDTEIQLFDFPSKDQKVIAIDTSKGQYVSILSAPRKKTDANKEKVWRHWLGDNSKFYYRTQSRDHKRVDIGTINTATGESKVGIKDRLNTYIDEQSPILIDGGRELIHSSERDGWAHYYLHNADGTIKNQITKGPFHAGRLAGIDKKKRVLYFTGHGREKGEDPYYGHLYRVNFDGTGLKMLNPGNYDHASNMNDKATYFVDNYSRVNTTPASALYDSNGRKIMDLETADLSSLMATGYKFPEPFKVKAADGRTDMYGVMYKPFDFDSTLHYPIIEYVYPGPFTEAVNKSWSGGMDRTDRLAQMGFIVITLGNRGGHPDRSKRYHNYGYGDLRDYGLADKKYVAEQLADRHDFIDISKVGITGHSGGGFMSTAAMLVYPDFFDVAVSSAGNHVNQIYNRWWSERHHGIKEITDEKGNTSFKYAIDKNPDLAKNLKGKLMLATGDIDSNVHPAGTILMAEALIKANKRFDFVLMPGKRHGFGSMNEYFFWVKADYFAEHLLGTYDKSTDIKQMNNDRAQKR